MNIKPITETYQHRYFDLTGDGLLKISGPDVKKFLQGQLTCDVETIPTGTGVMGAHCNAQGRMISLFYAINIDEIFYLLMPKNLINIAMKALKKYASFFKVTLEEAVDEFKIIGSIAALEHVKTTASVTLPTASQRSIYLVKDAENITEKQAAEDDWQLLNIFEGIPLIHPETSEKFLPHDLNLQALHAVSFTKGCFTGQEIIARMQYRGKPKNHLYTGFCAEKLSPGDDLFSDKNPAGTVIDCSKTMYNDRYALLFTTSENIAREGRLTTGNGEIIELILSE